MHSSHVEVALQVLTMSCALGVFWLIALVS